VMLQEDHKLVILSWLYDHWGWVKSLPQAVNELERQVQDLKRMLLASQERFETFRAGLLFPEDNEELQKLQKNIQPTSVTESYGKIALLPLDTMPMLSKCRYNNNEFAFI
jgi:hypothetical protein